MRRWVIGDVHGNYKGFMQVLERSGFNREEDLLVFLGDIVDGYSDVYQCFEELLTIDNLIFVRGNHDQVFIDWLDKGFHGFHWLHGGEATIDSYARASDREIKRNPSMGGYLTNLTSIDIPESHKNLLRSSIPYYILDNMCFVHGGFNRHEFISGQNEDILMWDRDLWQSSLGYKSREDSPYKFKIKDNFDRVFIGHTPTISWKKDKPMKSANIWNLDTGGGYSIGKVTIMNIDTEEYFQSDLGKELYKNEGGR